MSRGTKNNKDMEDLKLLVEEVLKKTNGMADDIQLIKANQEFISKQYDEIRTELNRIKIHMKEKDKTIKQLEHDVINLNEELAKEIEKNEALNQYGRRENLELHGIPVQKNENTNQIVINMMKHINIELKPTDISISHRLKSKFNHNEENDERSFKLHPPIIVKFVRRETRNLIFNKRTHLRKVQNFGIEGMTNLFINET